METELIKLEKQEQFLHMAIYYLNLAQICDFPESLKSYTDKFFKWAFFKHALVKRRQT